MALGTGACGDDETLAGVGGQGGGTTAASTTASTATTSTSTTAGPATGAGGGEGGGTEGEGGGGGGGGASACADVACADGFTRCAGCSLCQEDPADPGWTCTPRAACSPERTCGDQCCPIGARCADDGTCKLADIHADAEVLSASAQVVTEEFSEESCELFEGCIDAAGKRRLLKFSLRTPNVGEGDLFLGKTPCEEGDDDPACATVPDELYLYSACHDHYHFTTYANYRLLDAAGNVAATGHKQAFCLMDLESPPGGQPIYDCGFQGIQAGFADVYDSYLPCQWIDVTDVAPGDYRLEIALNLEKALAESNYDNNLTLVDVTIDPNSCAGGCAAWDDAVCLADDPQGRAGDGVCDCNGLFEWDHLDCASCDGCTTPSCTGGCEPDAGDGCCGAEDVCERAGNGVCDCGGAAGWDAADCAVCVSADVDCPDVDTCPEGCGWSGNQCNGQPIEEGMNDGWCDCADEGWDVIDCFSCSQHCEGGH